MIDEIEQLPPTVRQRLRDYARQRRNVLLLRAIGSALATLAVWTLLACAADRLFRLPTPLRIASLGLAALASTAAGFWRLRPLAGAIDWVAAAVAVERHDPRFHQGLVTVTSQLLSQPQYRGSDEMLASVLRDVERNAGDKPQFGKLRLRNAMRPWLVLGLALVLGTALCQLNGVGGIRLLARFTTPASDIPPVTTTELWVKPGDSDVTQSEPFRVDATIQHLLSGPAFIWINDDGITWAHYPMDDTGGGRFAYTLNAVSRDLQYYVTAGDAESRHYTVHVRRPPAVSQFRIHYVYPSYTNRPPVDVVNSDGAIEAPVGSDAELTIVSTEPLAAALMTIGDQKILMDRAADPAARHTVIHVQHDSTYTLDLISTRDVRGTGPGHSTIHASADHPPTARLGQSGLLLRLNPRAAIMLNCQASDDFGLTQLNLAVQINAEPVVLIPLALAGKPLRADEPTLFDLAQFRLTVGDLLTVWLTARDTSGQIGASEDLRILIGPASIDTDANLRLEELALASARATDLSVELSEAAQAIEDAERQKDAQSAAYSAAQSRASRRLASASESATALRQSLLRVVLRSDAPRLSTTASAWADAAVRLQRSADDLFRKAGQSEGLGRDSRVLLRQQAEQLRTLRTELRTVATGLSSKLLATDRENLLAVQAVSAPSDPRASERLASALSRAHEESTALATSIGIDLSAEDADKQIRLRRDEGNAIIRNRPPIDLAAAAGAWSQAVAHDLREPTSFPARLSTAAMAEALRSDSDQVWARDLEQAGRAAAILENAVLTNPLGKPLPVGAINAMAGDVAALQKEHALARTPAPARLADETRATRTAAVRARDDLARWTGENTPRPPGPVRPGELEIIAMKSGADAQRHDWKRAAADDRLFWQSLADAGRRAEPQTLFGDDRSARLLRQADSGARQLAQAESLEKLQQLQDRFVSELSTGKLLRDLPARQQKLAEQIVVIRSGNEPATLPAPDARQEMSGRVRMESVIIAARFRLWEMLAAINSFADAEALQQRTTDRASAMAHDAAGTTKDRIAAARKAAEAAEHDAHDAAERLQKLIQALSPDTASEFDAKLDLFLPELGPLRDSWNGPLSVALQSFQAARESKDAGAIANAKDSLRKIIEQTQRLAAKAQEELTAVDPLASAAGLSMAASVAMTDFSNDPRVALGFASQTSTALSSAIDQGLHQGARKRLASLPSLTTLFNPSPAYRDATAANHGVEPTNSNEAVIADPSSHESDPPGFEESLRLYFEAMRKSRENSK